MIEIDHTQSQPDYINYEWNIRGADNRVRVVLMERTSIGHYYTALERYAPELGDGIWKHVDGSSVGHGTRLSLAKERIAKLIDGEWKNLVKL